MSVADNITRTVDLLRSGVVVGCCVNEVARLEVVNGHLDGERLERGEVLAIHGHYKLGRGHICGGGDDTQWSGIARTSLDLLTVRDGQIGNGETEVDKVIARGKGGDLAGSGHLLAIALETSGNDFRIESQRRLGIVVVVAAIVVVVRAVVVVIAAVVSKNSGIVGGGSAVIRSGGRGLGGGRSGTAGYSTLIGRAFVLVAFVILVVVLASLRNSEGFASQQRNDENERYENS